MTDPTPDPMTRGDDSATSDAMSGGAVGGDVFATIRDVWNEGDPLGVTDPDRRWPDEWCERCGGEDGGGDDRLVLMIAPNGGIVLVHQVCGELCRATLTPPCAGAPDLCGAPAGQPCAPGCPSTAADPPATDRPVTDRLVTDRPVTDPGPTRG